MNPAIDPYSFIMGMIVGVALICSIYNAIMVWRE